MATITRENISLLNDKLTITLSKADYLDDFEKSLKKYAKSANIPGFRKGMVPAGLVKKMYGQGVFGEQVLRKVEEELNKYMQQEQLDIFAQPLPMGQQNPQLDMNQPGDYQFEFEIGLKPTIELKPEQLKVTRYVVNVTDAMIQQEVERWQKRNGERTEPDTIGHQDNVLQVSFTEIDAAGQSVENGVQKDTSLLVSDFNSATQSQLMGKKKEESIDITLASAFDEAACKAVLSELGMQEDQKELSLRVTIKKITQIIPAELNEELFKKVFPDQEITTEEAFRSAVKDTIVAHFASQARNQIYDQIYHALVDHTPLSFPENFLKRWIQQGGEQPKTPEQAEKEYPTFEKQLKWTLISNQLIQDNKIEVSPEDIKDFAKMQLFNYMGGQINMMGENAQWVEDYANRMLQDKKFVEDSYHRISTDKMFQHLETLVNAVEETISQEDFEAKQHHHH
ncbi:MAG: trigger factor [Chitinophagaceae bacterium]|jgi:trigger factor|nr:trigger factor [Chitinophagaceae bacterium]MCA6471346.1 trigger factor [Chitinophagaceae bacterium]MCA6476618.1 trigger factor [Chitinophagaceae bacterium]MCA6480680.1 trigger factor [Chitinophagaceae bacterium]MCA6492283.1 trigger factor [Chitinophagaceae bacterium]